MISRNKNLHWSNIFISASHKHNKLINSKLNKILLGLLDLNNCRIKSLDSIIDAYQSEELLSYQQYLLRKYFKHPSKYLNLDCDRLTLTFDCTAEDAKKLKSKLLAKKFQTQSHAKVLSVKRISIGGINNAKQYKDENDDLLNDKPFYNHAYRFDVFNNRRKFIILHLADGNHSKSNKVGFRVDFIPDRFTDEEIHLLFSHLRYVLSDRRYSQIVKKGRVTRVDLGINFYGLMSAFAVVFNFAERNDLRYTSTALPKKGVTETAYLGNRSTSNHFVLYEKLIKELKDKDDFKDTSIKDLHEKLIVTTRLERRYFPYRDKCSACRNKKRLPKDEICKRHNYCELCNKCIKCGGTNAQLNLSNLEQFDSKLADIRFIDPYAVSKLTRKQLRKLIKEKTHTKAVSLKSAIRRSGLKVGILSKSKTGRKFRKLIYKLNKQWLKESQYTLLTNIKNIITEPKTFTASDVQQYIDSQQEQVNQLQLVNSQLYQDVKNEKFYLKQQQSAYKASLKKHVRLFAGAGSGKTHAIVERVKYLLTKSVSASDITILAYNVDAKNELKERIPDDANISTFSAWCYQLLKSNTGLNVKHIIDTPDKRDSGKWHAFLTKAGIPRDKHELFATFYGYYVNKNCSVAEVISQRNCKDIDEQQLEQYISSYRAAKKERNCIDFNDLLSKTYQFARNDKELFLSLCPKYLIIDEMQDSSDLQWKIVKVASEASKIYCVGDPAQTIYGFRGANSQYLDSFERYIPNSITCNLSKNYRATDQLINMSNWLRKEVDSAYELQVGTNQSGSLPKLIEFSEADIASDWVVKQIADPLNSGTNIEDILVLCRTNKLAKTINQKLSAALDKKIEVAKTIHKSKGLEAKTIYLLDPRFSKVPFDYLSEHLRLLYVAFTRAKSNLIICKSDTGNTPHIDAGNSVYILDRIPDNLYEYLDV